MGRTRAVSVDVLARRLPAPVAPAVARFYRLREHAQRLQQQLALRASHVHPQKRPAL